MQLRLLFACLSILLACNNSPTTIPIAKGQKDSTLVKLENPYKTLDASPMDMVYFPEEFPQEKMKHQTTGIPYLRVIYSRPHKKGRLLFSDSHSSLVPYGKPWRLGANEATELDVFQTISIAGTNIPAGSYILYCIPYPDRWTIVLNKNLYAWGLQMDSTMDVYKTDIPVQKQDPPIEDFTMHFEETSSGANLLMAWDSVKAILPILFAKK